MVIIIKVLMTHWPFQLFQFHHSTIVLFRLHYFHFEQLRQTKNIYSRCVSLVINIVAILFQLMWLLVFFDCFFHYYSLLLLLLFLCFYIQHRIDLMHSIGSHLSNQINQSVRRTNEVIADTHLQNKQWTWAEARTYQPTYSVHDFL